MFDILSNLTKAAVGLVVRTPLAVAADVITLGGTLTDKNQCGGETYTASALKDVVKNIEKASK
jgi:hypothetical protein